MEAGYRESAFTSLIPALRALLLAVHGRLALLVSWNAPLSLRLLGRLPTLQILLPCPQHRSRRRPAQLGSVRVQLFTDIFDVMNLLVFSFFLIHFLEI